MDNQLAFDFSQAAPAIDGLHTWRAARHSALLALAREQSLPLGHQVRVEFENGPPLEGILYLNDEELFHPTRRVPHLHLRIGNATFHAHEISSCIRLD